MRSADDLARRRGVAVATAVPFAAVLTGGLALGAPTWLNVAAAAITVVTALAACALQVSAGRERLLERGMRTTTARPRSPATTRAPNVEDLPRDARVVFVSYAREDEEWRRRFETMLRPLGERGLHVWSDEQIAVGTLWRSELRLAIERADAALVLVTPDLLASRFVMLEELPALVARQIPMAFVHVRASMLETVDVLLEVQWAHDPELPVAGARDPDGVIVRVCKQLLELLPAAETHAGTSPGDLPPRAGTRSERLIPTGRPGELHDIPPRPPEFVDRTELGELREALLRPGEGAVGITGRAIGLHGQGGIGKTVLAAVVARDLGLREYFSDGVFWVTVGERGDVVGLQIALLERLGTPPPELRSIDEGAGLITAALADRRCLLVVDDVWTPAAAAAFGTPGTYSRVLYTTRDVGVLEAVRANVQRVDLLPDAAARTLLSNLSGVPVDALPPAADRILETTGRVALALSLVGAAIGRGRRSWEQAADALDRGRETFLDHPYADVFKAMQVGVAALDERLAASYRTLAVYPEDTPVPVAAVARLWAHLGRANAEQARAQLEELAAHELLVLHGDAITFHDLQLEFLLLRAGDVRLLHADVLASYRKLVPKTIGRWHGLPTDEPYIWEHLIEHLRGAGDLREMRAVVTDLAYLAARCFRNGPYATESDLRAVARVCEDDPAISWAIDLFTRSASSLSGHATRDAVAAVVAIRAQHPPAPMAVEALRALTAAPLLTPRWGMPDTPSRLLRVLEGHRGYVIGVTFSPDGQMLATGGSDGSLRLWDPTRGVEVNVLQRQRGWVNAVTFSPDGRTLACVASGVIWLWDVATGKQIRVLGGDDDKVFAIAFSPTADTLVSIDEDGTTRLWQLADGAQSRVRDGDGGTVQAAGFSPDHRTVAIAGRDNVLRLRDSATGANIQVLEGHDDDVHAVAFSPDGSVLVSASERGTIRLWDLTTAAQTGVLEGHRGCVRAVAVAPDGCTLVSAGEDRTLRLWDLAGGLQTAVLEGHRGNVASLAFSPDGRILASGANDGKAILWDSSSVAAPGTGVRGGENDPVHAVAFAPDGQTIASTGEEPMVRLWSAASGEQTGALDGHSGMVSAISFAPQGRILASAGEDATVRLWDAASGAAVSVMEGHSGSVHAVAYSPDGRALVTGSADKTVRLWDPATGAQTAVMEGHDHGIAAVAWSPSGLELATADGGGRVMLWELGAGRPYATLPDHLSGMTCVGFSRDGDVLVTADRNHTIRRWQRSGRRGWAPMDRSRLSRRKAAVSDLSNYGGTVSDVAFLPDGRTLVTANLDESVRFWDIASGAPRLRAPLWAPVHGLSLASGAIALATGSGVVVLDFVGRADD